MYYVYTCVYMYVIHTSIYSYGFPWWLRGERIHCNAGHLVWPLGQEDSPETGMATHSSIHTWRIPWTEEPGGLQSTGSQRIGHDGSDWSQRVHWQTPGAGLVLREADALWLHVGHALHWYSPTLSCGTRHFRRKVRGRWLQSHQTRLLSCLMPAVTVWHFAEGGKKKQVLQEDIQLLPIPERRGPISWGSSLLYIPFAWQK